MSTPYVGYWPTATVLYHAQDVHYLNIMLDKARQTLKELRTGYHQTCNHHWTLAKIEARASANDMQVVTNRMSLPQKVKHLLD